METFKELYERLVRAAVENRVPQEVKEIHKLDFDPHQLDCLLHPGKYGPVWRFGKCDCCEESGGNCPTKCLFEALERDEAGNVSINVDKCVGCSDCIDRCKAERLVGSRDILPVLDAVNNSSGPVYAMIAPAFISQFSNEVTPGKLRSAFKRLGFAGMLEVALFADILTLKEALEFDRKIHDERDFLLTSCCCPMWIAMIRRVYSQYVPHVPGSVSPMVACGRSIKLLEENAKTVFIGPCIAKKAEAREKDIADAVDYVLTFQEVQDIFEAAGINPAQLQEDERDHSSRAGRIYARTGGVSEAVQATVERLNPHRTIRVNAVQADGMPACKELLAALKEGRITANFLEGMGCNGGCVGGPKAILNREEGRRNVTAYGNQAAYTTPIDNPYVIELLHRLGFDTIESLLERSDIFTREF